ncbi:MAG: HAMP domain-containing sensor histidine kinase [Clostridia bacterium]
MSKKRDSLSGRELTRSILTRFFRALVIFTIALLGIFFFSLYISSLITWYDTSLLYKGLHLISSNRELFLFICWITGFIVIFIAYWKKTLGYIDTIAEASNMLVEFNEDFIHLPAELKQVENKMNQVKQEAIHNARLAKEAEQRKSDLIAYLAHDLKTPLTSVIGYLTLLRDEQQISEELREKYLSISLDKAERLEDLINEFFEITRFNLSQLTLELSHVNLTRMLEQIVYEFSPLLTVKNLKCSLKIDPDMEIKCDVSKIERVFDNLIRNAVNYSFENSTLKIVAKQDTEGVYMSFCNQGNNISKEKLERIFNQFYRLDTSRATKTGGAGLGLAIAKEIIELHHGTISASSENENIEIEVYLPLIP